MNQKNLILDFLKAGNKIDKIKAIELFNCYVLFARMKNIHDMIRSGELRGYEYKSERLPEHKNATVYWLQPLQKQTELF